MPAFCYIEGCGKRGEKDNVKFFRIPSVTNLYREDLNYSSRKRRQVWLSAIKHQDFSESMQTNARICSEHFVLGYPTTLKDICNPDWILTLKTGHKKQQFSCGTNNPLDVCGGTSEMECYNRTEKGIEVSYV